jgi:hypothetical protein
LRRTTTGDWTQRPQQSSTLQTDEQKNLFSRDVDHVFRTQPGERSRNKLTLLSRTVLITLVIAPVVAGGVGFLPVASLLRIKRISASVQRPAPKQQGLTRLQMIVLQTTNGVA